MKRVSTAILMLFAGTVLSEGTLTLESLPGAPVAQNPVCYDDSGTLSNCDPGVGGGVAQKYLVPIIIDGDGIELGTFLGYVTPQNSKPSNTIYSSKGYVFGVYPSGVLIPSQMFVYELPQCGGQAYVNGQSFPTVVGSVYRDHAEQFYYTPIDAAEISIQVVSFMDTHAVCNEVNPVTFNQAAIPLINNPDITGVRNIGTISNRYPTPLTLIRP